MKPASATRLICLAIACWLWLGGTAVAQEDDRNDTLSVQLRVELGRALHRGDSIPDVRLPAFHRYPPLKFNSAKERDNYNRMVRAVRFVLPYAQIARDTLLSTQQALERIDGKDAQRAYRHMIANRMKKKYTRVVMKMARSQGKLLVKMIHRECGANAFDIVRYYMGKGWANTWQVAGAIYGINLKKKYDPEGEDKFIERIVRLVESGQL